MNMNFIEQVFQFGFDLGLIIFFGNMNIEVYYGIVWDNIGCVIVINFCDIECYVFMVIVQFVQCQIKLVSCDDGIVIEMVFVFGMCCFVCQFQGLVV